MLTAIVVLTSSAAIARETKHVMVGDVRYRVTVDGTAVTVARKSLFSKFTLEERDAQRKAVVLATGCTITDELPSDDARLRGRLACSKS